MSTLGFDSYVEPLKVFLSKYRDSLKTEKTALGVVAELEEGMVSFLGIHPWACIGRENTESDIFVNVTHSPQIRTPPPPLLYSPNC